MKNIIIIEDWAPFARALKASLEDAGHQVTWLIGADSYATTDGGVILQGLTAKGKTLEVDCRRFQIAFVDGQLKGNLEGPDLVKLLVQSQVACCGMSTESHLNHEMQAVGATMAFKKAVILAALMSNKLSVNAVLAPTQAVLSRLTFLESRFHSGQFAALRERADAYLAPFMAEEGAVFIEPI